MRPVKKNSTFRPIAFVSLAVISLSSGNAGAADSATANATATVMTPISIAKSADLDFGAFAAGTGGTVVIGTDGSRSSTGAVVESASDTGNNAEFAVSGQANATYAITLPGDGTVTITSGANSMAVNTFTSDPSGTGTLDGSGNQALNVGATLVVGSGQAAGSYTGTFDVTVEYN